MKHIIFILGFFILSSLCSYSQITPEEYLKKGDSFCKIKNYDNTIEQYDKAIKFKSDFAIAYINKGQALEFKRKFEEAIDNYNILL